MAIDFRKLGEISMDDIKPPKAFPAGTYHGIVKGYRPGVSRFKDRDTGEPEEVYLVDVELHEAGDDIDPSDLNGTNVEGKVFTKEYSVKLDRLYVLKNFLGALLGKENIVGQKLPDVMEQIAGHSCVATLGKRVDKNDPTREYNDLKSIGAAA